MRIIKAAPSRQGKRQVIAFLRPDTVDAIHKYVNAKDVTVQEFIGHAINEGLRAYGRKPIMTPGHSRLVRRRKSRSSVRTEGKAPPSRTGRKALSGWFDAAQVDVVAAFTAEVGIRIQDLVTLGANKLFEQRQEPAEFGAG